jgi:FkbM family methyltransferase
MNKNEIKNLLLGVDNPVIFEIGSADSGDTVDFLNVFGENVTLYCFEPEPTNIAIAKEKLKLNLNMNVFYYEGLVSDQNGVVTFNRSRSNDPNALRYSGSYLKPKNHLVEWDWIYFDENVEVKSTTLDSFCDENNIEKIDFIWADVQGAEALLIEGGKNTLKDKVKYFYTEYSDKEYYEDQPTLNDIKSLLGDGWDVLIDFKTDVLFERKNK